MDALAIPYTTGGDANTAKAIDEIVKMFDGGRQHVHAE